MKASMGRIVVLVATCMGLALAMSSQAAYAAPVRCLSITGSGSSLQKIGQTEVFIPFFVANPPHSPFECEKPFPQIEYIATSSGRGENCFGAETGSFNAAALAECGKSGTLDDYIGTDIGPEKKTQIENMERAGRTGVVTVPVAQSAISIIVAMPPGCVPTNQEHPRVADLGLSSEWSSDEVPAEKLIENVTWSGCPQVKFILFARSSNSGTTAGFKHFLDQANPTQWKAYTESAKKSQTTEWPQAAQVKISSPRGKELAERVSETPGSMGYADLADARAAGFTSRPVQVKGLAPSQNTQQQWKQVKYYIFFVQVENKSSPTYASPEVEKNTEEQFEGSNCIRAEYNTSQFTRAGVGTDWSGVTQINAFNGKEGEPYPICTLTYDVGWQHYRTAGYAEGVGHTVRDYLKGIVVEKQTKLDQLHYAGLGKPVKELGEEAVANIEE